MCRICKVAGRSDGHGGAFGNEGAAAGICNCVHGFNSTVQAAILKHSFLGVGAAVSRGDAEGAIASRADTAGGEERVKQVAVFAFAEKSKESTAARDESREGVKLGLGKRRRGPSDKDCRDRVVTAEKDFFGKGGVA